MEMRYPSHPAKVKKYTTKQLRREFLIKRLFVEDEIKLVYSHIDRIITGGAYPASGSVALAGDPKELGADFFLQRRELGVVNVGGPGTITADGTEYAMNRLDGLYIGMGTRDVVFASADPANPARFYLSSTPAHHAYPTTHIPIDAAEPATWAASPIPTSARSTSTSIPMARKLPVGDGRHAAGSEQHVEHHAGSHARAPHGGLFLLRYPRRQRGLSSYGRAGRDAPYRGAQRAGGDSPSWSIHAGMGTGNYAFIWAMAGENQTFSDMDAVAMTDLR